MSDDRPAPSDRHRTDDPQRPLTAAEQRERDPAAIRSEDTEPYTALQYVAVLFKIVALITIAALTAQVVAEIALEGTRGIWRALGTMVQGIVQAAILWGAGDLVLLLIDVGHDVRAERVLLGRLSARLEAAEDTRDSKPDPEAGTGI